MAHTSYVARHRRSIQKNSSDPHSCGPRTPRTTSERKFGPVQTTNNWRLQMGLAWPGLYVAESRSASSNLSTPPSLSLCDLYRLGSRSGTFLPRVYLLTVFINLFWLYIWVVDCLVEEISVRSHVCLRWVSLCDRVPLMGGVVLIVLFLGCDLMMV